jgi:serine-type D-Ala-D-Ala carboxypeptidase (penicillin-binding protein 5/6)
MRALLLSLAFALASAGAHAQQPPLVAARAWLLADLTSGQVLAAEKADERFAPASLTKLMASYVVFGALREGKLAPTARIEVSERAWRAVGSRMFVQPGKPVVADELIYGMVVQSGNDATIALAEAIAGSEAAFAERMNRAAARLGMGNSNFINATGLPGAQHYSTARDLHLLSAALIREFPHEYARYYPVREYRYNNITQLNRNRLLWLDASVDGVKTGYAESAGYCLVASAQRGGRRLLSVVLGAASESSRAQESQKLLNWGYQHFDGVRLFAGGEAVRTVEVWKGAAARVSAGFADGLVVTVPKGQSARLTAELLTHPPVVAPVATGQRVGMLRVQLEGKPLGEYPVVALEGVAVAGFFGRAWDTLRLLFQ